MDVFIYHAALLCEDCATAIRRDLIRSGYVVRAEEDSDDFPCGPYSHGGGESDCPQHCDACGVFLENALTADGSAYVKSAFKAYHADRSGSLAVLQTWADAYREEYGEACQEVSPNFPANADDDWLEILPAP